MSLGALVRKLASYGHDMEQIADIVDVLSASVPGYDTVQRVQSDGEKAAERRRKDAERQKARRAAKRAAESAESTVDAADVPSERPQDVHVDAVDAPSRVSAQVVNKPPSEVSNIPPLEPTVLPPEKPKRKRRSERPKTRRCPDDWEPNDGHRALVLELGLPPDRARMALAKFRDHEFNKPHSDWDAAFRNWLRNDAERTPANGNRRDEPTDRARERTLAIYGPMARGAEAALARRGRRWGGG